MTTEAWYTYMRPCNGDNLVDVENEEATTFQENPSFIHVAGLGGFYLPMESPPWFDIVPRDVLVQMLSSEVIWTEMRCVSQFFYKLYHKYAFIAKALTRRAWDTTPCFMKQYRSVSTGRVTMYENQYCLNCIENARQVDWVAMNAPKEAKKPIFIDLTLDE